MTRVLDGLRLLFGAVLVVTALRYFLPPLLPFVPQAQWHDPMALRLMTGFDKSGLLAVLPVSFTVWYWDTELQGWWTGSAVYGWAVLSCNLLLCLAYWPSYRAMFASDARPRLSLPGSPVPLPRGIEAQP